ncbi:hypothetical protein HMPREF1544_05871 [Mucor circinelloides 1006PhL]|uniref:Lipid droplet-associated perilipin protein n=1 Tax=Mucor circinelloides f. circinelloides (strain 1006PhL) TaxID=1220926 RepID=S2JB03_MUCC1|nr:hypothetical protein HMPREF1544_05871 [Mucor circinelloides 1006PhL]KAG1114600.1 hypothetical protein G6F42_014143 [Rhizopus arrhizus]
MDQQNISQIVVEEEVLSDTASVSSSSSDSTTTTTATTREEEEKTGKFVSRVTSFPIVQESVSTVHAIANKTSLGRFALLTANSTLSTVSKYTNKQPTYVQSYYESYIQPHVEKADALGCRSLDLIQNKFPVVNQPTSEIVRAVTAPSYQIVDGVKVRIDASIKQPANQVAKEANKRIGSVVDNVEAVLDRYLPATNAREVSEKKESSEAQEINQAVRAYYLLNDATSRLSQRVTEQVKTSASQIPRSRGDLARITETSALVQKTTANIQVLQETIVQSVSVYAQAAQKRLPPAVTERLQVLHASTNEKLATLTQQVSTQLSQLVVFVKVQSNETPEWLKNRVASLVEIANNQIDLVRTQFSRSDISSLDKAKNVAQALQNQVLPILQNVQAQLNHYSEVARQKASTDLKAPLEYLGLAHAPKLASAQ